MPGIQDWTVDPFSVIDRVFEECEGREEWVSKLEGFFKKKLEDECVLKKLLSIPETPLQQVQDGQVVRFRCQVQDMYDPEYYVDTYQVEDKAGNKRLRTSRYREVVSCKSGEVLVPSDSCSNIEQRSVVYCISLPGQNDWVTEELLAQNPVTAEHGSSGKNKRVREEEEEAMEVQDTTQCEENKRAKTTNSDSSSSPSTSSNTINSTHLNFPIPNERCIACLVKFYEEPAQMSLNDVFDIIGVVSLDPSLGAAATEEEEGMGDNRGPACHLPPSLVPRIHALSYRQVAHSNPLLPVTVPSLAGSEAREARELLRQVMEEACLGDPLVGDYLVCHLLGDVYSRQDLCTLGQFSLNVSGISKTLCEGGYPSMLYGVLQQLTTHSHMLPLTTNNLNAFKFIPKKDYGRNELTTGLLQLPRNTQLTIDETVMQPGRLDSDGVANLEQIANVLRNQQCKYDFQFHRIQLNTNINVLVLSEAKSMLPCESELVLSPLHTDVSAALAGVQALLTPSALSVLRRYITSARLVDYQLTERMQKDLQEEFVAARKNNKDSMSPEQFHSLLALARLVSMSCGASELQESVWRSCKILENKREQRITAQNRPAPRLTTSAL